MSLLDIWHSDRPAVEQKRVRQLVQFAGDGRLGDDSSAPNEFRAFLARVGANQLESYVNECLQDPFLDSGLVLQDLVNEIGSRLGFEVEHGRYRGARGQIGHDGLWKGQDGHYILVEVKTTDAYRLSLDALAGYRDQVIHRDDLDDERCSILIVVGRRDTGELEAQIRGSRHAWDIRVISADSLVRLLQVRQEIDDPNTEDRIRSLLRPHEYTRVDSIIDLVFTTAEDVAATESTAPDDALDDIDEGAGNEKKKERRPVSFNDACASAIEQRLDLNLKKESRIMYLDADNRTRISCAVSKQYTSTSGAGFWFAFHRHQLERLQAADRAFAAFGCGSEHKIILFPLSDLEELLPDLNKSLSDTTDYWHIHISQRNGNWFLRKKGSGSEADISRYLLSE